jgi:DNA-binding response OmpR family regulator
LDRGTTESLNVGALLVDEPRMREVLIVDDSPDLRGMLAYTLGDLGFTVRQAKDGYHALEELAAQAPDCVILDLMMPDMDGFKVLEVMRNQKLAPNARVVILSSKDDERALVRGFELHADEFFLKPVDPNIVAQKISALIEAG